MPVQPESTASSARYSSAASPTAEALTRIGRSLLTTVTSKPSSDRFLATDRMRVSLSPSRKPAGSELGSVWLSSTRSVPPSSPTGHRGVEPPLADPQVVEQPQRLPGEVAQLGVVPLGLELGDDDHRQHDLVLLEPQHGARVGQQDGGVEDERRGQVGGLWPLGREPACGPAWRGRGPQWLEEVATGGVVVRGQCLSLAQRALRRGAPTRERGAGTGLPHRGGAGSGPPPGARTCSIGWASPNAGRVLRVTADGTTRPTRGCATTRCVAAELTPLATMRALRRWYAAARASPAAVPAGRLSRRSGGCARRRRAGRGGSRRGGSRASRPRRSRTRCARSARAGNPDSRCSPEVRMTRSGSGWPLV